MGIGMLAACIFILSNTHKGIVLQKDPHTFICRKLVIDVFRCRSRAIVECTFLYIEYTIREHSRRGKKGDLERGVSVSPGGAPAWAGRRPH
jgi:hypothetical protein